VEVALAGRQLGLALGRRQRRQQKRRQDGDDGNHHQQFNERKAAQPRPVADFGKACGSCLRV
jgi:hypothetical protein